MVNPNRVVFHNALPLRFITTQTKIEKAVSVTRKTGKALQKARQQLRAWKMARAKRELSAAGLSLTFKRPPAHVLKEKGEELRKLYLDMFQESVQSSDEEGWQTAEEIAEEEESTSEETVEPSASEQPEPTRETAETPNQKQKSEGEQQS